MPPKQTDVDASWPMVCTCERYPYAPHWHYPEWTRLVGDGPVYMMLTHWWPDSVRRRSRPLQ